MFLCSRWGKSKAEVSSMPVTEFYEHRAFWDQYRWGMSDDLSAMTLTHMMRKDSMGKVDMKPWELKQATLSHNYTFQFARMVAQPLNSIRQGFMAIYEAVKGMGRKNG